MSEPIKVTDGSQKWKILIGLTVLLVLGLLYFNSVNKSSIGTELPITAISVSTATSVQATVTQAIGARFQATMRQFANLGTTDIYLGFGTTTNIHNGYVLQASSVETWTVDNGNLYTGIIYASSSGSQTNNLKINQIP